MVIECKYYTKLLLLPVATPHNFGEIFANSEGERDIGHRNIASCKHKIRKDRETI